MQGPDKRWSMAPLPDEADHQWSDRPYETSHHFDQDDTRRVLRSNAIRIGAMLALGGFWLFIFKGDHGDPVRVYRSMDECASDTAVSREECRKGYDEALAERLTSGPRYTAQSDCFSGWGFNRCTREFQEGREYYIPSLHGFTLGRMVNGVYHPGAPLYKEEEDSYPSNGYGGGHAYLGRNGFLETNADRHTASDRRSDRTHVVSRGGFGKNSRTYRS